MHITSQFFGQTIHADTLYFAWACMLVILIGAFFLASGLRTNLDEYNQRQFLAEGVFGFIRNLTSDQIGKRGDHFVFFIGCIFLFILTSYYAGLLPWKMGTLFEWWPQLPSEGGHHGAHAHHPWHGASPCADINIPAGIAIIVIATYFLSGVFIAGGKYLNLYSPLVLKDSKGSFLKDLASLQFSIPFTKKAIFLNLMCLIELMDLAVRPLTLSLRLFANTVAGETLLGTFISFALVLPALLLLPLFVLGFEMGVGLLQSFIFTVLSTVYIGVSIEHAEHLLHDDH